MVGNEIMSWRRLLELEKVISMVEYEDCPDDYRLVKLGCQETDSNCNKCWLHGIREKLKEIEGGC